MANNIVKALVMSGILAVVHQITGGTGRFKGASGALQSTGRLTPVLFNASDAAVLVANAGELKGTVQVP